VADPGRTFRTPEGRYVVEFLPDAGEFGTIRQLLDDLYAEDVLGTTRLLESLRWDVPTELEEMARRWRDGRLRDQGFPDLEEALADARATLSLGRETLSGGDPDRAAAALVERPVREISQAGLVAPYRLQPRARRIAQSARLPRAQNVTLLDPPLSDVVDALQRKRPVWPDPSAPRRRPALDTLAEVREAERLLDEAESVVALLRALGL